MSNFKKTARKKVRESMPILLIIVILVIVGERLYQEPIPECLVVLAVEPAIVWSSHDMQNRSDTDIPKRAKVTAFLTQDYVTEENTIPAFTQLNGTVDATSYSQAAITWTIAKLPALEGASVLELNQGAIMEFAPYLNKAKLPAPNDTSRGACLLTVPE